MKHLDLGLGLRFEPPCAGDRHGHYHSRQAPRQFAPGEAAESERASVPREEPGAEDQAQRLAQELDNQEERARAELALGDLAWREGHLDEALAHMQKAFDLARGRRDERLLGEIKIRWGAVLADAGKHDESLGHYREAIDLLRPINDFIDISRAYNNIGVVLRFQGKQDEALESYRHAMDAADKVGYTRGRGYALANSIECLADKGEAAKAGEFLAEARKIFEKMNDRYMLSGLKLMDALIADLEGRREDAEAAIKESVEALREFNSPADLAWAIYREAVLLKKWGRPEAGERFEEAERIYVELGNEDRAGMVRKAASE